MGFDQTISTDVPEAASLALKEEIDVSDEPESN
jgi:hypothetical protein